MSVDIREYFGQLGETREIKLKLICDQHRYHLTQRNLD